MSRATVSTAYAQLWVCCAPPAVAVPSDALILSFMPPAAEAELSERYGQQLVSGRRVVDEVRARARAAYVDLIARIGATPGGDGRTLRQVLEGPGHYSRWWLLDITEKDCLWDEDPIYLTLLRVFAVERLKEAYGIARVEQHGSPRAFAAALGEPEHPLAGLRDLLSAIAVGTVGRCMLAAAQLRLWARLRLLPRSSTAPRDVMLQGYWDWTIQPDAAGGIRDRYFTDLPGRLAACGLSVGWLASCELTAEPWQRARSAREIIRVSSAYPQVTLVERFLTPWDIIATAMNLRYPWHVTNAVARRSFRASCRVGGCDAYPLVRRRLLRSAWGATFCRLQLVATAVARASRRLRPKVVLTAFELFLRARAVYAGLRSCTPRPRTWAAQHAGYSTDKTLGVFDVDREVHGNPDGCAIPAPDGIYAMGDLSRRLWEAAGFSGDRVVTTGGLRYQAVRVAQRLRPRGGAISILLAGGVCEAAHADLCDAVVAATSGLPSVHLVWRDHPYDRFSERPEFDRFRGRITVTVRTLDDDLRSADLVLFSQTGLAEEALLRGIPTWQWLWAGFNTSPFVDLPLIPSFSSVAALRRELEMFTRDPDRYAPTADTQQRVLRECFGPAPAQASARMAELIRRMIDADARRHA